MPDYCKNIVTVSSVPSIGLMEEFVPYFEIPNGCTSVEVFIKVPNNCYYIAGDNSSAPAGGACGTTNDLQHTIDLDQSTGCTNTTPTILSITLNYSEDPTGEILYVYTVDRSDNGKIRGGAKGVKTVIN
jgi:hypothetical protein